MPVSTGKLQERRRRSSTLTYLQLTSQGAAVTLVYVLHRNVLHDDQHVLCEADHLQDTVVIVLELGMHITRRVHLTHCEMLFLTRDSTEAYSPFYVNYIYNKLNSESSTALRTLCSTRFLAVFLGLPIISKILCLQTAGCHICPANHLDLLHLKAAGVVFL